jgi:hypothetical protein
VKLLEWLRLFAACLLASFLTAMFMDDPDAVEQERVERLERTVADVIDDKLPRLATVAADQAEALRDHADLHDEEEP